VKCPWWRTRDRGRRDFLHRGVSAAFNKEAADLEAVGRRGGFKMEIGAVEGVSVLKPTELSFPPKTALIS
jgi:hypothetical protein